MKAIELLKKVLEIRWPAHPSHSDVGYYFTISADNRDLILGATNQALAELAKQPDLEKEIERLKDALEVIAPPKTEGYVYTSEAAADEAHKERLLKWLRKNSKHPYEIITGTFYALAADIAEQALKERPNE